MFFVKGDVSPSTKLRDDPHKAWILSLPRGLVFFFIRNHSNEKPEQRNRTQMNPKAKQNSDHSHLDQ